MWFWCVFALGAVAGDVGVVVELVEFVVDFLELVVDYGEEFAGSCSGEADFDVAADGVFDDFGAGVVVG